MIPSCDRVAESLQLVYGNLTKLSEVISGSDDASTILSSLDAGFTGENADGVLKFLAIANLDLGEAISAQTDKTLLSLNLLNLGGINDALDGEASAETTFSELFDSIINDSGTSSASSGDTTAAGEGLQNVVDNKEVLIESVSALQGVSGAAFSLVVSATGVTQGLKDASKGLASLSSAVTSKASDLPDVDFTGLVSGLDALSKAEADLAAAVESLVE